MSRSYRLSPEIWLESDAVASMLEEGRRAHPMETGGLLIGYWSRNDSAVVSRVIGPGPRAIQWTDSFEPDYGFQEAEIARIHIESQGVERYLGDWHTHPDGGLYLSAKDRDVLRRIADHEEVSTDQPLMLVLVTGESFSAAIWRYNSRRKWGQVEICRIKSEDPF